MRNCLFVTAKPYATISHAVCRSSCVSTWIGDMLYERFVSRHYYFGCRAPSSRRQCATAIIRHYDIHDICRQVAWVIGRPFGLGVVRSPGEARGRELVALGLKRILRRWAIKRFAFFYTIQKGVCHFCGRTEFIVSEIVPSPSSVLTLLRDFARGQNTGDDAPGPSSTVECPEVTTIPYGDEAFVYGNVCGEGPGGRVISPISGDEYGWAAREVKELRSQFRSRVVITNWIENSCVLRTLGYQTCIKLIACRDDERDPLRFTSWPEDKMTIEELEALSVLTALPRSFSSRQLIDCLEFDDAEARVFEGVYPKRIGCSRVNIYQRECIPIHLCVQERTSTRRLAPISFVCRNVRDDDPGTRHYRSDKWH
ncbi:hypothetical protein LR48_Vigan03g187300 [Vigna angularis]|uniref:Uncharacterized protein n=1 Tax=Phaseolus angularis TaxID=3914 RepID=A0A0L9U6W6_PHAAN|nr:hypothetical protein LR48_Vigan03g187300 [Vigna angularis]